MLKQLCLGIAFFTLHSASGQESALAVGIKWVDDLTLYHGLAPGFGGQVTYRLGRHAGVESGVYYSTWDHHFIFGDANGYSTTKIAERHLYFPLLYRHEARKLNFTIGAALDLFLAYKNKTGENRFPAPSLPRPKTGYFLTGSLSKSIFLFHDLFLEPELRLNWKVQKKDGSLGLNIALRKKFY